MRDFGLLIKTLRSNACLTQKMFAEKLNVNHSTVSKWENQLNYPDIITLRNIANTLNVTCDELLNPTETLKKLSNISSTPIDDTDSSDTDTNLSESIEPDETKKLPILKTIPVTKKRILLVCLPILLFIISISLYIFTKSPYKYIETRNNVETVYGSAYELVYTINDRLTIEDVLEHSSNIETNWRNGLYKDCNKDILVISYYLSTDDMYNWNAVQFRTFSFSWSSE